MNKSFIVFLAVCLISVHAFVKRDAEKPNVLQILEKQLKDTVEGFADAMKPDSLMKQVQDAIKDVKNTIENLAPKPEHPKQN